MQEKLFEIYTKIMMQKIFLCLLLVLILPDIFIYRIYISNFQISTLTKYLYFLPSLLLLTGLVYLFYVASHDEIIERSHLVGWFIMTYFIFALPKLTFTLISIFDLPLGYFFKHSYTPFTYAGFAAAVIGVGILIYGSIWGKTKFDIKPLTY